MVCCGQAVSGNGVLLCSCECSAGFHLSSICLQDVFACEIYEEIIRYHIMCEHELCEREATVRDPEGFSSHLNVEQLNKVVSATTLVAIGFSIFDAPHLAANHGTNVIDVMKVFTNPLLCGCCSRLFRCWTCTKQ